MTRPRTRDHRNTAARTTLSRIAWIMMLEDGLDAVTPGSVAARADLTTRTFRYHFRNREEAIPDELDQQRQAMVARIRSRPPGEPLWDCLLHTLPAAVVEMTQNRDAFASLIRMIDADPQTRVEAMLMRDRAQRSLIRIVSERTDTDHRTDPYPGLLGGALTVTLHLSIVQWATGATETLLPELIRSCLLMLRAGL
ncbi:TetR family transcriptional regulator [Actinoplanes sp. NPDC051851]|uniref:TetR/AcrR family transcriptional regulator n=1 Tax=Actinoplanes sp. NPDC051851 TaxID=3154753 RepID=UPI00343B1550